MSGKFNFNNLIKNISPKKKRVNLMVALEEMSGDHQRQYELSSCDKKCQISNNVCQGFILETSQNTPAALSTMLILMLYFKESSPRQ